jgi:hypothetical protein
MDYEEMDEKQKKAYREGESKASEDYALKLAISSLIFTPYNNKTGNNFDISLHEAYENGYYSYWRNISKEK